MPLRQVLFALCISCVAGLLVACGGEPAANPDPSSIKADSTSRALYGQVVKGIYLDGNIDSPPLYVHKINPDRHIQLQVADAQSPSGWRLLAEQEVSNFGYFHFDGIPAEHEQLRIEVLDAEGKGLWAESTPLLPPGQVTFRFIDETRVLAETEGYRFIGVHLPGETSLGDAIVVENAQGETWSTGFDSTGWAWLVEDDFAEGDYTLRLAHTDYDQPPYAPIVECLSDQSWSLSLQGRGTYLNIERPSAEAMSLCTCHLNCSNY